MFEFFKSSTWSLDALTAPWGSEVSIYVYIRDNPKATELPDTARPRKPNELTWSSGALDGVFAHHMSSPNPEEVSRRVQKLSDALKRLLKEASNSNLKSLYETVLEEALLPIADPFQSEVSKKIVPSYRVKLAQVGRYFAAGADHREATKFGIVLLEVAGTQSDATLLETLALNDEFTLFAALALAHVVDDPAKAIWNIAKRVHGWGRIQVVERLSGTQNPEIQAWMLREGFRNEVMDGYLAGICARTGNLHRALDSSHIDRQLLDGAAGIIRALIEGGPADSIDDYEHSPAAIQLYLSHVLKADGLGLDHFLCVSEILRFLSTEEGWESRFSKGWTGELRDQIRDQCREIVNRDVWPDKIAIGLKSEDPMIFDEADVAAAKLRMDTRDLHFARVRSAPITSGSWYRLLQQTEESQIDEVVDFATRVLPLEKIATGPDNHLGLGPGYEAHGALDWLLQDLKRFPGRGWELIKAGLRSPVVRNRNMALQALLAWPRDRWPAETLGLLQQAVRAEPNEDLRGRFEKAIRSN
ncbi:MAG: hypothetical protein WCD34_13835 [Candidatus Acidiferrum sp.]